LEANRDSGCKVPEEDYLFFRKEWQVGPLFSEIYRAGHFLPSPIRHTMKKTRTSVRHHGAGLLTMSSRFFFVAKKK